MGEKKAPCAVKGAFHGYITWDQEFRYSSIFSVNVL